MTSDGGQFPNSHDFVGEIVAKWGIVGHNGDCWGEVVPAP
jgi:hypothetical protein